MEDAFRAMNTYHTFTISSNSPNTATFTISSNSPNTANNLNDIVTSSHIERKGGGLYNYIDEVEVDPSKVVYANDKLKLKRTRACYCYTGFNNEFKKKKDLSCVIKASDGKRITNEDMVAFFESDSGKKFTSSCNHAYLEVLFPTGKAHEYDTFFGS